jgi:hypothetical protein
MSLSQDAASQYAELGWSVAPAPLRGKSPIKSWKGAQANRLTSTKAKTAFGGVEKNIFVVTGAISRLAVLDCDSAAATTYWRERLGDVLDETTCATSGRESGEGRHYYFRLAEGEVHKGRDGDGWTLRAEAGGVIAPPSLHASGSRYAWSPEHGPDALQDAPAALWPTEQAQAASAPETRSRLAELLADPPGEGERNNWLTALCGHLAKEITHRDAYDQLVYGYGREVGLDDAEIKKTADSIWRTEHDKPAAKGSSALAVHSADLSKAIPPRWAWDGRLVLGYLNLLIGNEGIGKGVLITHLIARLTHGELPGDYFGKPISVGVVGDEDSFDGVWTPRLHAAGADLARVKQIEQVDGGFVHLKDDQKKLAAAITEHGLGLLFLDALLDNLGVSVDDWKQKAVRDALQPARAIARSLDIAVLGSLHPNKRADTFRQLVSGTVAFNAVSRSSLLLAEHPEDELRRVLVRGKGNLSKKPPAFEFRIKSHRFRANKHDFDVPLVCDIDESALTIDDLLGDAKGVEEHSKVKDACEIIETLLPRDGKWHEAKPMFDAAKKEKIAERTVQRAKQRLCLENSRTESFPAATLWRWGPLS